MDTSGKKCCLALQIKIEQLRLRVDPLRAFVAGLFPDLPFDPLMAPNNSPTLQIQPESINLTTRSVALQG